MAGPQLRCHRWRMTNRSSRTTHGMFPPASETAIASSCQSLHVFNIVLDIGGPAHELAAAQSGPVGQAAGS